MPFVEEQTRLSIKNILLATVSNAASGAILSDALAKAMLSYALGFAGRYYSITSLIGAASLGRLGKIIREREIDFVIVGTHTCEFRESDLEKVIWELLRSVPCPMLIIGPRVTQVESAKGDLERIVYVTDYTISSLDGLPYALALAQDRDAQLKFVHVSEGTPMGPYHFGNSRIVAFRKRLESLVAAGNGFSHESAGVGVNQSLLLARETGQGDWLGLRRTYART